MGGNEALFDDGLSSGGFFVKGATVNNIGLAWLLEVETNLIDTAQSVTDMPR